MFDSIYPGIIPMSKIKWRANTEADYVANYKLLQSAFDKTSHKKHIEVMRLIKCRYQDSLEFGQWFHAMSHMHGGSNNSK